jgi:hypothetical protein
MGIEYGDERIEVAFSGGCEERFDDLPLGVQVGVGHGGRTADAAAGTASELPRRLWRALHDRGDLLEWHGEHVVQDECQSFGRGQRFEYD